jgi:hypothetical protein
VPRRVEAVYTDPDYRYKWARAAVMNRSTSERSPWIAFLKQRGTLKMIGDELRKAGAEYRALLGIKLKARTAATRRRTKLEKAIETMRDENIIKRIKEEFGDRFKQSYADNVISTLQDELKRLKLVIGEKPPPQPSTIAKSGQGYGLREGLVMALEKA